MTLLGLPTLKQTFLLCVGGGGGTLQCSLHRQSVPYSVTEWLEIAEQPT